MFVAKENKSGLGRGLSSLIGGYEAAFKKEEKDVSRETNSSNQLHNNQDSSDVSRETLEKDSLSPMTRTSAQESGPTPISSP